VSQALDTWRERLDFFQQQQGIVSDPDQKFALIKQIEEAKAKIAELEAQAQAALPGGKATEVIDATLVPLPAPGQGQLMKGIAMPQFGSPVYFFVQGQSPNQIAQTQPKPRLEELFEIIIDPDEVPKALFRTEASPKATSTLVPYQVAYVQGRDGVNDVKEAIEEALSEAKGRLLVCGAAGIGKTREVAEFAQQRCARDWKICVALSEGDERLGELAPLRSDLADGKLLVVIDNLHSRILAGAGSPPTYGERLKLFLSSLERQVPDKVLVIAMAHSESRFQRELDLDVRQRSWHDFGVYQLPGFTLTGLQQMLTGLVAQAKVAVDEKEISKLVENSDRKPRTLFINVNIAFKNASPLTEANWGPNEGDLWKESFRAVRGKYPGAGKVYAALRMLTDAGLPNRKGYVAALSCALAGADTTQAIDALVDKGLLGLRQGMLATFSEEQLVEVLRGKNDGQTELSKYWEFVINAVKAAPERPPEWQSDLVALAYSLNRHQLPARGEEVASFAIEQNDSSPRAYIARAGARFLQANWSGSETDLTEALKRDPTDADAHFLRGTARNMLGDFSGMETDMDNAIKNGRKDSMAYACRGMAQFQQQKLREAEGNFSTAMMDQGKHDPKLSFYRGMVRFQLNNFSGAEEDFTAALDHGLDIASLTRTLEAIERGDVEQAVQGLDSPDTSLSHQDDGLLYGLRGISRFNQSKFTEAENDLTLALEHGFSASVARIGGMFQTSSLPGLASVKEKFSKAQAQFGGDAPLYYLRGFARASAGKLPEAEEDFDAAIQRGQDDSGVYFSRGATRFDQQKLAEAEADLSLALDKGKTDVATYSMRGAARIDQGKNAEAEQDLDAAVKQGRDDAAVFFLRGMARFNQQKLAEAEADLSLALDKGKADAPTYSLRGAARIDQGKNAEAERDFDAAIEHGRDDAAVFYLRGMARSRLQKLAEAEADLSLALDKGKTDAPTYSLRGAVRIDQGKNAEAEQDLDAAVEYGRDEATAFFLRGMARHNQQKYAEAEDDLSLALEKGKTDAATYALRGASRLALEKWEGAEEDLSASIKNGRDDAGAYYNRGRARVGQEKFAEAEGDFDAAIARGMDDEDTHVRRGRARLGQDKWTEAEQDFTAALTRGQDDAFVHLFLGLTRLGLKRYAEAECDFDAALARNPDFLLSYQERGRVRLIQGKMENAEQDFDFLITREPENADAYRLRGFARYGQGNIAGAIVDYDIALAKGKPDAGILADRVSADARLGRLDDAEKDCARVTDLGSDSPEARGCLGVLHLARGDFAKALNCFQSSSQAAGGEEWQFWMGLSHLLLGQPEAAGAAYRKGMAGTDPGDARIALGNFEFWITTNGGRLTSDEARRAIAEIRSEMAKQLNA
jgi:Tfp pilus assembly protein PilF